MEAYESSLSKDIFSNPIVKNTIDVYKSKHGTTVGCVFEYNGKQYEIKFADESDLVERFEKFTKQMSADVLETIENHKHQ